MPDTKPKKRAKGAAKAGGGPLVGAKTKRRGKAFCARLASCFSRCKASASKNAHRQQQRMEQRLKGAGCKGVSLRLLVIDTAVDSKNVLPNSLLRSTHCVVYDSSKETLKVRQAVHDVRLARTCS